MGFAARCLWLSIVGLALAPGAAAADVSVNRDADTGQIVLVESPAAAADTVTIEQTSGQHIIRTPGVLNDDSGACDDDVPNELRCPLGTSIAVDLGENDDRLITVGLTAPITVAGGAGNDVLAGGSGPDVLAGGAGDDTLSGGVGVDDYFGETGNDIIEARDDPRAAERISCGADADEARNDFVDIIAECERGADNDRDGFSSSVDCNDAVAAISPGAPEVFENGVDENCDGRDNVNPDRDRDGFPRPADCDDGNAAVRPNTPEVRGNRVDENCDRRALPWAQFAAVVSNRWAVAGGFTRLRTLIVRNAPQGTRVTLRCSGRGCPFRRARRRTVRRDLAPVRLDRGFARARLRPGARLRLQLSRAQTIRRTYTFSVQRRALPTSRTICRPPGARSRSC